jgi:hypothetical protein
MWRRRGVFARGFIAGAYTRCPVPDHDCRSSNCPTCGGTSGERRALVRLDSELLPRADVRNRADVRDSRPAQMLTWCRPPHGLGPGGAFVNTTEFCLFARRGSLSTNQRVDSAWWLWSRRVGPSCSLQDKIAAECTRQNVRRCSRRMVMSASVPARRPRDVRTVRHAPRLVDTWRRNEAPTRKRPCRGAPPMSACEHSRGQVPGGDGARPRDFRRATR